MQSSAWCWHVGLWLCSAVGLGQVAIRQMSLLQSHHSTWQPGWGLFAAIHKPGFVLLVGDAVKYEGEELILVKEPKNESMWKENYLHFSVSGLSSSGQGHIGRMSKQSLLQQLILSMCKKNCFLGLAAWSLESLSTFSTKQKKSYPSTIFLPAPKCGTPYVSRCLLSDRSFGGVWWMEWNGMAKNRKNIIFPVGRDLQQQSRSPS